MVAFFFLEEDFSTVVCSGKGWGAYLTSFILTIEKMELDMGLFIEGLVVTCRVVL